MARESLSDEEIDRAIGKIRQMYDDYIVTYLKPFTHKQAFEDRYYDALKKRVGLTRFVLDEISVVRALCRAEDERIEEEQAESFKRSKRKKSVSEYADELFEQYRLQITKYPDLYIDEHASYELRKLFGALDLFEREYWPALDRALRKLFPSYYNNPASTLEPRIHGLTSGAGHSPPRLSHYQSLLSRYPKSQKQVEWEEKRLIVEGAHLLHLVSDVIARIEKDLTEDDMRKEVERTREFVHTLIADFRMKDLRPSGQGVS